MDVPLAEIFVETAGDWEPLDVRPSTSAPIVPYQPPPSPPPTAKPITPRVYVPTADYFDSSKPNHVNVDPRDWTPEVRELNDLIDSELEEMGRNAVAEAEWQDYVGGRRGRNLAGQIMDAIPLIDDAAMIAGIMGAVENATGIPVMPASTAGALLNPNDGFLDFLHPFNWFGQGSPIESGSYEGPPELEGGQCSKPYNASWSGTFTDKFTWPTVQTFGDSGVLQGPLTPSYGEKFRGMFQNGSNRINFIDLRPLADANPTIEARNQILSFSVNISPVSGPDDCGDAAGDPVRQPTTTQDYTPTDFADPISPTVPSIEPPSFPDIFPDIPGIEGDDPTTNPEAEPIVPTVPELPGVPDLPETDPTNPGNDGGDNGNQENFECCEKIDFLFKASGEGLPCDEVEGQTGYSGSGLDGVYLALEKIWDAIKCPDDNTASLPTHWEAKVGEIPQLIVQWKRISGGSSRWDFHIPHPKESISHDFEFNFPTYIKGSYQATMKLSDNSSVRINALDKQNAGIIMRYIRTLINPAFLIDYKDNNFPFVGSELNRQMVEDAVTATYVKSFAGHLTTTPLWVKSLS